MSERKYTDDEIVKALEICIAGDSCKECPINLHHGNYGYCTNLAITHALDLINRQKAEIERLQADVRICESEIRCERIHRGMARAEAVKEFVEKLKQWQYESSDWSHGEHPYVVEVVDIDNLVAEMTEGK